MIDLNGLPEVGGVKVIDLYSVLKEIGCEDRPYFDPLSTKLLHEWMESNRFGYVAYSDFERPMFKAIILKAASEQFVDGMIYDDLS